MKVIAPLIALLICSVGISSATITGITPNPNATTDLTIDTVWESETLTTKNLIVKNLTNKVDFYIYNSTITIDGYWILGSDTYNIGSNTFIENSTIIFNTRSSGTGVYDSTWFEGATWGTIDTKRYILIATTTSTEKLSNFTMNNSLIKGYNATTRAYGVRVRGTGDGNENTPKPHKVVVTNTNFSYLGGAYDGSSYYALNLQYYDAPPWSYGSVISNDSELRNITFYYCGRGIGMPNHWDSSKLIDSKMYYGGVSNSGKYYDNLYIYRTTEPLGQLIDGFVVNNSWIDADYSKLNFDRYNGTVYNTTITRASMNLGDASANMYGTEFYNNTVTNSVIGTRRGDNKIHDNNIGTTSTGSGNILNVWGHDQKWYNNSLTASAATTIKTAFNIVPHSDSIVSPWKINGKIGNNHIYNNIINGFRWAFYVDLQHNLTIENNTLLNCQDWTSYSFYINGSQDVKIIDMELSTDAVDYDIRIQNSENIDFINVNQNDARTSLSSTEIGIYYYLDVLVTDNEGTPISDATVSFTNSIDDVNHPSKNLGGDVQSTFTTDSSGHLPLPYGNSSSVPILLDYNRTLSTKTEMLWDMSVDAVGYNVNNSITGINLSSDYYRVSPNTYQNTTTIILSSWNADNTKSYVNVLEKHYVNGTKSFINIPLESNLISNLRFEAI